MTTTRKTAISPTRQEDYALWYQEIIKAADLAETSPVRGCMVIKPWGFAIWENIQRTLDKQLKLHNHQNVYFPLLIPLRLLEKEATHVDGFAKECAVVTHHRLIADGSGGLIPDGELEEPLIIRPTSETIIGESFANWIKSYRDLPLLINQWANIMRWEMRTRMFLRTSEFLWQEGHTAHANADDAIAETLLILKVYTHLVADILGIPVIQGKKPCFERFPGAVTTYSIEAMMQDKKALQAGTSHFLGQNFATASNIKFTNKNGEIEHVWTTSWGVTTRLIGALIMVHSDDDGLVLPPRISPYHIVIIPIIKKPEMMEQINQYCKQLAQEISILNYHDTNIMVHIDKRDMGTGDKIWQWIKKGVPLRLEIGLREIDANQLTLNRRDKPHNEKLTISKQQLQESVCQILEDMQNTLFAKAHKLLNTNITAITDFVEFKRFFSDDENINKGFASCYAIDDPLIEEFIKPLQVTARCIPLDQENITIGKCIFSGKTTAHKMIFAKAY
jgi:prolyl-tRNA synthetase